MGKVKNPAKALTKGRTTPLVENQKPTTARGHRRSAQSDEYVLNCKERKAQRSPSAGGRGNPKLPFKGPSKRPKSVGSQQWERYMSGISPSL